jgi:outer membrane protein insertion porin family/translocation and assembly module TamA
VSRGWLAAFAAACACGGPSHAVAPAEPGGQLAAIRIAGNHAIASDALESQLALHEAIGDGAAVDPYLLGLDTARIRAAYLRRGFFAVTVTPDVEQRGGRQVVTFTVAEGRRAVSRVEITGLPADIAAAEARARVGLGDGAPFDYDAYDAAKPPLADLIENAGYAHVRVTGAVTAEAGGAVAAVRYTVEPGPRCTFGEVRIPPLAPDLAAAVRARLPFATGDRYSAAALAAAQTELYQLGRFASVTVAADRSGDRPVIDVAVELAPATRREVHLGGGLGYEPLTYSFRGIAGGSVVFEDHPLVTAAADGQLAVTLPHGASAGGPVQPKVRLLGSLQQIDLGWPRVRGEIEGGADYQTLEAYSWVGGHVRLGLGAPLGPRWLQVRIGWLVEELAFVNIAPEIDLDARQTLRLDRAQRLGAYQASLVADLRDDPSDPHRGVYAAATAAVGTPYAGGATHYRQVTPELRGYVSLGGTVVAIRARAGKIFGEVPVTERYFSGGAGERGFSDRQLAPRVVAGQGCSDREPKALVIGGAGLIETGVELRRPLVSLWGVPFGANLFLDGADVTCHADSVDPLHLRWAVGTGLWGKPVGLKVRVELGYRLDRMDPLSGGSSAFGHFAWHIGVGEAY